MARDDTAAQSATPRTQIFIRVAACALATVVMLLLHHPPGPAVTEAAGAPAAAGPHAPALAVQVASMASTIQVIVARNDTLESIFRRMALDPADLAAIRQLPGIRQSLDFLKPGDAIKLTHTDRAVRELTRKVSDTETLKVVRADAGFTAQMIQNPVQSRIRTARGTIESSLFQAAEKADMSDAVALKLADIFGWDIDFVLDLREGDRFTAVYEQIYEDGRRVRDGEILAAEFVNNGKTYRAVRYTPDGGRPGYYTPAGLPMRKAFLRAPVEFTRVSSKFNPHRLHPILNRIRGHMGTDYAAPTGTPVHAAAAGRVSFAGTRGGYGNAVMLAHSGGITTLYGHLSRFARHLAPGTRVEQGEVIGYVGMTGLATGPHLHYEYLVNGVHRNPETLKLPGGTPLPAQARSAFAAATQPLMARLAAQPTDLATIPGGAPAPALAATAAVAAPVR
jgi:murein DD-endopeptidase MepM/ murein hydrolase activator NlpD